MPVPFIGNGDAPQPTQCGACAAGETPEFRTYGKVLRVPPREREPMKLRVRKRARPVQVGPDYRR